MKGKVEPEVISLREAATGDARTPRVLSGYRRPSPPPERRWLRILVSLAAFVGLLVFLGGGLTGPYLSPGPVLRILLALGLALVPLALPIERMSMTVVALLMVVMLGCPIFFLGLEALSEFLPEYLQSGLAFMTAILIFVGLPVAYPIYSFWQSKKMQRDGRRRLNFGHLDDGNDS